MVHLFSVSSVVRDTTDIKMFGVLPLIEQNFLVKENQELGNPRGTSAVAVIERSPKTLAMFNDYLISRYLFATINFS